MWNNQLSKELIEKKKGMKWKDLLFWPRLICEIYNEFT